MEQLSIEMAALMHELTLFSGFDLGTILMQEFALFFPLPLVIAATAVAHFAKNLFKFGSIAQQANWSVMARCIGRADRCRLAHVFRLPALLAYCLGGAEFTAVPARAVIGSPIALFAALELLPRFQALAFPPRWLPVGRFAFGLFRWLVGQSGCLALGIFVKRLKKQTCVQHMPTS